jgi:uncharacterized membrane protein YkvI
MNFINSPTFKKYFIPGIVFQSVVIAGGYGTGREIVEFFLNFGTLGGLIAMLAISTVIWSLVCAATFEFARVFKAYDYRTFFKELLGKFWVLYEICYYVLLLIVLAVVASAAGSILEEMFGLHYYVGVIGMMAGVGALVVRGKETIEKFLSYWSFVLYSVYIVFLIFAFSKFGSQISAAVFQGNIEPGWAMGGFQYAFYNLGIIPAVLFATRHLETRREAVGSGIFAGIIGIVPGLFLYLAMIGQYPEILGATVPTNHVLTVIGSGGLQFIFQFVLFITLIETGTGFIYAVNERIFSVYKEKKQEMPRWVTAVLTVALLILGAFIAQFGLIGLIAKGYGTITWGFFVFYVIPVLTIGVWKIMQKNVKSRASSRL